MLEQNPIKSAIEKSGLRQNVICRMFNEKYPEAGKISDPTLTRWKTGEVDPPFSKAQKLLALLQDITLDTKKSS